MLSMISYNMLLDRLQYMNKLNKSSSIHGEQDAVGVHLKNVGCSIRNFKDNIPTHFLSSFVAVSSTAAVHTVLV